MTARLLLGLSALALAACAPAAAPPAPPAPVPAPPDVTAPAPALPASDEAPANWHLLEASDSLLGIGVLRAERELLAGRQPQRTVVVAVIDGGVDTAHVDLAANLWRNPRETAGNGRDDDGNGYVDDVFGWSYIGGPDGENVHHDTFEVTRLYVRCTSAAIVATLSAAEREACPAVLRDYDRKRSEAEQTLLQIQALTAMQAQAGEVLRRALGTDSLTEAAVRGLQSASGNVRQARDRWLQLVDNDLGPEELAEAREAYESQIRYGYNTSYNPRPIVQDDTTNPRERRYGNRDVMGPDADHGTHVAGIIGAVRGNGAGVDGIAPAVRIMALRAVPDGDERDKDVANAIRYAVDNGAQIINMSFGKAYSPDKAVVDAAVRYADSAGVLLVHAAGNDGANVDSTASYPTPVYLEGGRARNWIEVGATSWHRGDSLVANFSNFGQLVDVFAPGVDILSTMPGNRYERESGTSMAAPVVSGLAAFLMAYYPTLTAADVKRIILESATKRPELMVRGPGQGGQLVRFGALSSTGGVVNAYEAVRLAERMAATRP